MKQALALLLSVLLVALLLAIGAHAAPPPGADGSMAPWFHSLTVPGTGGSCCDQADCRNFPVATQTGEDGQTHFHVLYDGKWLAVPDGAIQERADNPTGDYVTCVNGNHWAEGERAPDVLCFFKAPRA